MIFFKSRIEKEKVTVEKMIKMYCRSNHEKSENGETVICKECADLLNYTKAKLDECPYGNSKPTCQNCPILCYAVKEKSLIKEIMNYSGPRMLFNYPVLAMIHYFDNLLSSVGKN